jgi:alkylation response protein AidB-like acyl-CoA dehydrogenase
MADGFFPLTHEQQEWAARSADIAQRELAPRAAEIDRTGTYPSEGLEALKREGFWGLRVSRAHGGKEESLLTTVLVTEALAKRCASTSLCYKMHLEASELVARIATPDQVDRMVRPIVSGNAFYTGSSSPRPITRSKPDPSWCFYEALEPEPYVDSLIRGAFSLTRSATEPAICQKSFFGA